MVAKADGTTFTPRPCRTPNRVSLVDIMDVNSLELAIALACYRCRRHADVWVLNIKDVHSLSAADSSLLFTCVKKQMAWTYLMVGDGRMAAGRCQFGSVCVCVCVCVPLLSLALVLCCPSPLPFSLSLPALLSLQPAWQTGGQATPLRPAGCERRGHRARSHHQLFDT